MEQRHGIRMVSICVMISTWYRRSCGFPSGEVQALTQYTIGKSMAVGASAYQCGQSLGYDMNV